MRDLLEIRESSYKMTLPGNLRLNLVETEIVMLLDSDGDISMNLEFDISQFRLSKIGLCHTKFDEIAMITQASLTIKTGQLCKISDSLILLITAGSLIAIKEDRAEIIELSHDITISASRLLMLSDF